jgi:hypothetical protein
MGIRKTERAIKQFAKDISNRDGGLAEPVRQERAHITYKLSKVALNRILDAVGQKPENRPDDFDAPILVVKPVNCHPDKKAEKTLGFLRPAQRKERMKQVMTDPNLRAQLTKVINERLRPEGLELASTVAKKWHSYDGYRLEARVRQVERPVN